MCRLSMNGDQFHLTKVTKTIKIWEGVAYFTEHGEKTSSLSGRHGLAILNWLHTEPVFDSQHIRPAAVNPVHCALGNVTCKWIFTKTGACTWCRYTGIRLEISLTAMACFFFSCFVFSINWTRSELRSHYPWSQVGLWPFTERRQKRPVMRQEVHTVRWWFAHGIYGRHNGA